MSSAQPPHHQVDTNSSVTAAVHAIQSSAGYDVQLRLMNPNGAYNSNNELNRDTPYSSDMSAHSNSPATSSLLSTTGMAYYSGTTTSRPAITYIHNVSNPTLLPPASQQSLASTISIPPITEFNVETILRLQRETESLRVANHALLQHLSHLVGLPYEQLPTFDDRNFRIDAQARKTHRRNLYCAGNRSGLSSCSWHASRHQPKVYGSRKAPAGYLNCGCTFEEALFEASLAANGVGAYRSGAGQPRLDPTLRRALLQLLQRRYSYQDGDFEIDTRTGWWLPDQDAAAWQRRHQLDQKD